MPKYGKYAKLLVNLVIFNFTGKKYLIYPTFDFDKKQCQHFAESLKTNSEKKAYFRHCLVEFEYEYLKVEPSSGGLILNSLLEAQERKARFKNVEKHRFYIWCKRQIENLTNELEGDQLSDVPSAAEVTGQSDNSEMPQSKIQWQGTEGQLIYLVKALIEKGFLPKLAEEPYAFIEKHFVNKHKKPFKKKQLSQAKHQCEISKTEKPKNADVIDQIVEGMEKQNQKH